jgi:murein DD-endopeptidase MepM/ murein hydrolase activator NlpD
MRGRQRTPIHTITPRRRVRILFFSTWGSDYNQIDFSAKTFGGLLLGFVLVISILAVFTTQALNRFVQEYRLAALTEDHQILRSRLNQTGTRVSHLAKRMNGEQEEEAFGLTQKSASELPAFINAPDKNNAVIADSNRSAGVTKRGPLGLAWKENDRTIAEQKEREQNFYGQGGGAYVDDEDNIYPTRLEKERANLTAPSRTEITAGIASSHGADLISQLEKNLSHTQELQKTIIEKFEVRRKQLEHIPSIKPLLSGRITDLFGKRVDPFVSRIRHHQGLDISSPRGTEVFAPADGMIEFVKTSYRRNSGYGKAVVINHGYGIKTLYGHLSEVKVKSGQKIERWDIIGLVGETGRATGPHLHYEVWVDGAACDPLRFILNN